MKRATLMLAALALLLGGVEQTRAGPVDYVVSNSKQFGTIDLQTGVFTSLGTADWSPNDMTGLPGGPIYGMDQTDVFRLIDPTNGHSTIVGTTGNRVNAIKFRQDGTLFGLSAGAGNLYTIDKSTGTPTLIGGTGISFSFYDLAFDSSNQLFAVNAPLSGGLSNLYGIDPSTAAAHLIGPIGFRVSALQFEDGTLYGFTGLAPRPIISIDRTTGVGTVLTNQDPLLSAVFGAAPAVSTPEPSTLTLLGIGAVCSLGYGWQRRRRSV